MSAQAQKNANIAILALAVIGFVLFVANVVLINGAQAKQRDVATRQAEINSGLQIGQLNNELVRALGTAVVSQKDEKAKDLLAQHGITVSLDANRRAPAAQ